MLREILVGFSGNCSKYQYLSRPDERFVLVTTLISDVFV